MIFRNRKQTGQLLGRKLQKFIRKEPLVLALPRGGVPVAAEIVKELGFGWNVLITRKIGAPFHPELAVGAICEDDEPYLNLRIMEDLGIQPEVLGAMIEFERNEIERKIFQYRAGLALPNLENRTVIVVDDGLATGATMKAALLYLRKKNVAEMIVAVPVAAAHSSSEIRLIADEVIALQEPFDLTAVGNWYEDFRQVSDEEVQELLANSSSESKFSTNSSQLEVKLQDGFHELTGDLTLVSDPFAVILFAHGSGSSRKSPRNQTVAKAFNQAGFATLMLDLLTEQEASDRRNVFDLSLLSRRLVQATHFLETFSELENVPIGFFGASTGAGAAFLAAASLQNESRDSSKMQLPFAIVSRGGRPDLASSVLPQVQSPSLLIVGERDPIVLELNEEAYNQLPKAEISIIPRATHLFEEPGALDTVARMAVDWFLKHLPATPNLKSLTFAEHPHRQM